MCVDWLSEKKWQMASSLMLYGKKAVEQEITQRTSNDNLEKSLTKFVMIKLGISYQNMI